MKLDEKIILHWRDRCNEEPRNRLAIYSDEWRQLCDLALKGLSQPDHSIPPQSSDGK